MHDRADQIVDIVALVDAEFAADPEGRVGEMVQQLPVAHVPGIDIIEADLVPVHQLERTGHGRHGRIQPGGQGNQAGIVRPVIAGHQDFRNAMAVGPRIGAQAQRQEGLVFRFGGGLGRKDEPLAAKGAQPAPQKAVRHEIARMRIGQIDLVPVLGELVKSIHRIDNFHDHDGRPFPQ